MRMVKKGYTRFVVEDNEEEVVIKALKARSVENA